MSRYRNFLYAVSALCILFRGISSADPGAERAESMKHLRDRCESGIVRKAEQSTADWKRVLDALNPDGAFQDLIAFEAKVRKENLTHKKFNYQEPQSTIMKKNLDAFRRLETIAGAWRSGKISADRKPAVMEKIFKAILRYGDLEVNRIDTHAGRWHSSCFEIPRLASNIYFYFRKELEEPRSSAQNLRVRKMLRDLAFQAWSKPPKNDATDKNPVTAERFRKSAFYVGGNATAFRPLLESALVLNDPGMVDVVAEVACRGLEAVSHETRDQAFWEEGITVDGAGWAHGKQMQVWEYPIDGILANLRLLEDFKGTVWQSGLTPSVISGLLNYIRGSSWFFYKGYEVPTLARNQMRHPVKRHRIRSLWAAKSLLKNFRNLLTPQEIAELEQFSREATAGNPVMQGNPAYSGIRVFPQNDKLVVKNADYYFLLNMASFRCDGIESGTSGFCMFSCDGATVFQRRGDDWNRSFGAFDVRFWPGVTNRHFEGLRPDNEWCGYGSASGYCGSVTDGKNHFVSGFEFEKYPCRWKYSESARKERATANPELLGISARKACFGFGTLSLMLGSGISDSRPGYGGTVVTTIEQSFTDRDYQVLKPGSVYRNRGFVFGVIPGETDGKVSVFQGKIPLCREKLYSGNRKEDGELDMFRFWIEHPVPVRDRRYAYYVAADGKLPRQLPEILSNSADLQAARMGNVISAVFYRPGVVSSELAGIRVSAPCVLLLRKEGENRWKLILADPLHDKKRNSVTLTISLPSGQDIVKTVKLPGGVLRGTSAALAFSI